MEDLHAELKEARQRLADFDASSSDDHLIERLKAQSPFHPLIMVRNGCAVASTMLASLALGTMVVPLIGYDWARQIHRFNELVGLSVPVLFLCLAVSGLAIAVATHQLALAAAHKAPLLPEDLKQRQRLTSDIRQLESQLTIRNTPAPVSRLLQP